MIIMAGSIRQMAKPTLLFENKSILARILIGHPIGS